MKLLAGDWEMWGFTVGCGTVRPKAGKARRACQYGMMIIFPAELLVKFEMHL